MALGRTAARVLAPPGGLLRPVRHDAHPGLPETGVPETGLPETGVAAARGAGESAAGYRGRFIVGRDTRRSSPLLQAALSSGLAGEGLDVVDAGVLAHAWQLPSSPLNRAYLPPSSQRRTTRTGTTASSSSRPAGPSCPTRGRGSFRGRAATRLLSRADQSPAPTRAGVGHLSADPGAIGRYQHFVLSCLEGRRLDGLRVALDCANGAAFASAPAVFEAAGADFVAVLAVEPDGLNINDGCGSTDPRRLVQAVVSKGADVGLALDGDADRVIAVDAGGNLVDGDRLIALFATDLAGRGRLENGTRGRHGDDKPRVSSGDGHRRR